jgi:hypothetical protein
MLVYEAGQFEAMLTLTLKATNQGREHPRTMIARTPKLPLGRTAYENSKRCSKPMFELSKDYVKRRNTWRYLTILRDQRQSIINFSTGTSKVLPRSGIVPQNTQQQACLVNQLRVYVGVGAGQK